MGISDVMYYKDGKMITAWQVGNRYFANFGGCIKKIGKFQFRSLKAAETKWLKNEEVRNKMC